MMMIILPSVRNINWKFPSKFIVLFCLLTLSFSNLFADKGYGISIRSRFPKMFEKRSSEIFTISFIIQNNMDKDLNLIDKIELPTGWEIIPFIRNSFYLNKKGQVVKVLAVKIPKNCIAKDYNLTYMAYDVKHPGIYDFYKFTVVVLPMRKISVNLIRQPKYVIAQDNYEILFKVKNTGNVETKVDLKLKNNLNYQISLEENFLQLKPNEEKFIKIFGKTSKKITKEKKYIFSIDFIPQDVEKTISKSIELQIVPKKKERYSFYNKLPMISTFGYGLKENEQQLYTSLEGKKIDEEKKQGIEFYYRQPFVDEANVQREFGGEQAHGYFHLYRSSFDFYGGDGKYVTTPLTMEGRYGRGVSFEGKKKNVKAKIVYVDDTSSMSIRNLASTLSVNVVDNLDVYSTFMFTWLGKDTAQELVKGRESPTFSIRSTYNAKKLGFFDVELASSSFQKDSSAYLISLKGKPVKSLWYNFEKIYSSPKFFGYYSDLDQFNTSIGFAIYKNLRANFSYGTYDTNLNVVPAKNVATRDKYFWGGLNYLFPQNIFTSVSYNYFRSYDLIKRRGFRTGFGRLDICKPFKYFFFQTTGEYGKYFDVHAKEQQWREWLNYEVYLSFLPNKGQSYTLYTKQGSFLLMDVYNWSRVYGASAKWSFSDKFDMKFSYQRTTRTYQRKKPQMKRDFYNIWSSYRFDNGHEIKLDGYRNIENGQDENETKFLVTYSIPFNMPFRKKKLTAVRGRIVNNLNKPLSNISILCDREKKLTDDRGEFVFAKLKDGNHMIWVEDAFDDIVSQDHLPMNITLRKNQILDVKIKMEKSAQIKGSVDVFALSSKKDRFVEFNPSKKYEKKEGLSNVVLLAIHEDGKEVLKEKTNKNGEFVFSKLKQGKWRIKLVSKKIPKNSQLENFEKTIEMLPGDEKEVSFRILPKHKRIKMIDSGKISLNE